MTVSREKIRGLFLLLLEREPESDAVYNNYCKFEDCESAERVILSSPEYQLKYSANGNVASEPSPIKPSWPNFKSLEDERIVFMHIPKTGGTSLHEMLKIHFDENDICPERYKGILANCLSDLLIYKYFSGHFDILSARSIPGRKKIVTIFRNPRSRLLSHYYFYRAHDPLLKPDKLIALANELSLLEFLDHKIVRSSGAFYNPFTFYFLGLGPLETWESASDAGILKSANISLNAPAYLSENSEKLLDLAKANLNHIDAIGILEKMDLSVANIFSILNLPQPQKVAQEMRLELIGGTNKSIRAVSKKPVTDEEEKLIGEYTQLDDQLYEEALKIFDKQTQSLS